jgi:hypothetical protein
LASSLDLFNPGFGSVAKTVQALANIFGRGSGQFFLKSLDFKLYVDYC